MSPSEAPLRRLPYLSDWIISCIIWIAALAFKCSTTPTSPITFITYALFTPVQLTANVLFIRIFRNAWLRRERREYYHKSKPLIHPATR
jgi:hypothetical protein